MQQSIDIIEVPDIPKKKNDRNLIENVDFGKLDIRKYINAEIYDIDDDL